MSTAQPKGDMSSHNSLVEKPAKAGLKTLGSRRGPLPSSEADIERIEKIPGDVSLVEPKLKPKKTKQLRRHLARFWLCYCTANVVFLAIFLPILYALLCFWSLLMVQLPDLHPRHCPARRRQLNTAPG